MLPLASIPAVCDVVHVRGRDADPEAGPDLLLEVPHGATRAADYDALRAELQGSYPDDLQAFFFVNTDVGAPEVAVAVAHRFVADAPQRSAVIVRCLIPRTFVDCNRVIEPDAKPQASAAGEVTPGLHAYVQDAHDRRLLLGRYAAYRQAVTAAYDRICGNGGLGLMVHSYAPRSIDVPVDADIVARLRREYEPDRIVGWPLRAEVDFIVRDEAGQLLVREDLLAAMQTSCTQAGYQVAVASTYTLHPATLAHAFAVRHPGSTLCLELRRDLLVRAFTPFAEMVADPEKVDRVAGALAAACAVAGT
ncbi:MAG: N-formylglutamate amidohydrolase [Phycisphaerales bacterium]|nr:N-formylglutamate amidohydrolase [Phycisphaerales bacterium]